MAKHNLLPPETLVDVSITHKITKEKTVKTMSYEDYLKLNDRDYTYQSFQVGFLKKEK